MAHQTHVPKFGNWDGDNVPYTAYFENARKEKSGGVRINPNDSEQNPEAFGIGNSNISHHAEEYDRQRDIYYQQKSASRKTAASEPSSDKSRSDSSAVSSVLKPNHQRIKSDHRKKYSSESCVSSSPGPNKLNYDEDFSYRSVSVPKFGEWDENDPRSAEGFTVIFNKVKEEKQIAASKFPTVPINNHQNHQANQKKETTLKKWCCCLF